MRLIDEFSGAVKRRCLSSQGKWRLPVWARITSLALAVVLAASAGLGLPLHPSERGCNMPMETKGCEQMGMAPGVTPTALCCLLNCQEPGPTGTAFNLRVPLFSVAFLHQAALTPPATLPRPVFQANWWEGFSFTPPKPYLKNLALLI